MKNRKSKLRVLQVIPPVGIGGAERLAVDLAKYINKEEFEVAVLSLGNRLEEIYEEELEGSNIPSIFIKVLSPFHPLTIYRISKFLLRFKPHIIHSHLKAIRYVLLPSRFVPVLAHIHTIHTSARRDTSLPFDRFINRIAFKYLGVIPVSVSRDVANTVKAVYGINSSVIYNGVNLNQYFSESKRDTQKKDIYILNVGRLKKEKNHRLLLDAFHKVKCKDERTKLIIVGDGELREELESQVRQIGLNGAVLFLGWRKDIPMLMRDCDIFVLSSDVEGFGIVLVEAMASGKPVIATKIGGMPELVEDKITGILVPPRNPDALAEAILKLIRDKKLREEMGRNGREKAAREFSIFLTVQKYERLYKSVIMKKYELQFTQREGSIAGVQAWQDGFIYHR